MKSMKAINGLNMKKKREKIPPILYKYRNYSDRSIQMLIDNQLYFSLPNYFNDPFDCIGQEFMLDDFREDFAKYLASSSFKVRQSLLKEEQIQIFRESINQEQGSKERKNEIEDALNEYKKTLGVLSLASRCDSILMWSHYADCHKGFCIGFKDHLGLRKNSLRKVVYKKARNKKFPLNCFKNNLSEDEFGEKFTQEYLLTKYIDWKYEDEWRIIAKHGVGTYEEKYIDRIIFGLKMPIQQREHIIDRINHKDIRFFEAIRSSGGFSMEIKPINS
jgi:hypothetical protein